ncbi:MAG: glycosyltransferase family 39 protein [Acidobacteria bacterium]|nr:glycosyltransferase family 39 protein [Acidobacteriota bacterium]
MSTIDDVPSPGPDTNPEDSCTSVERDPEAGKGPWPDRLLAAYRSPVLLWLLVAFGAGLRIAQYLFNRSLWVDESYIALNVIERSFGGLLEPLFHNQAAPIGYLWASRLAVDLFGTSEYALRLVPLAGGVASIVLFLYVGRRVLSRDVLPGALLLFAVSDRLIYYASEVKQYSTDVAVALALLLCVLQLIGDDVTWRRVVLLSTVGAMGIWVSHPAIFVAAGGGLSVFGIAAWRRDWPRVARISASGAVWASSFAVAFVVSVDRLTQNTRHLKYWASTFMPTPPFTIEAARWFRTTALEVVEDPGGVALPRLAVAAIMVGLGYLLLFKRDAGLVLIAPVLLCLTASGLHKYPFGNRLVLFLVPTMILLAFAGVEAVLERIPRIGAISALALGIALVASPAVGALRAVRSPREHEEVRAVLEYVRDSRRPGDVIYLYYAVRFPMRYYAPRIGFSEAEYTLGKNSRRDPERYLSEIDALRGHDRVWIVFTHATRKLGLDEQQYILEYLDGIGVRLEARNEVDAAAYLYDLR